MSFLLKNKNALYQWIKIPSARLALRLRIAANVAKIVSILPQCARSLRAVLLRSLASTLGLRRNSFPPFSRFLTLIGVAPNTHRTLWRTCAESNGQFFLNLALHRNHIERIQEQIGSADPAWSILLKEKRAIILMAHHDFQHTLVALLGKARKKLHVLAAAEETSPLFPWLSKLVTQMHQDCALHFPEGGYVFLSPEKNMAPLIRPLLRMDGYVCSLHDFPAGPHVRTQAVLLLGKLVYLPSGFTDLVARSAPPLYFCHLVWRSPHQGYHVFVRPLDNDNLLQSYANALSALVIEYPWAWDGWQWFEGMIQHDPSSSHA